MYEFTIYILFIIYNLLLSYENHLSFVYEFVTTHDVIRLSCLEVCTIHEQLQIKFKKIFRSE